MSDLKNEQSGEASAGELSDVQKAIAEVMGEGKGEQKPGSEAGKEGEKTESESGEKDEKTGKEGAKKGAETEKSETKGAGEEKPSEGEGEQGSEGEPVEDERLEKSWSNLIQRDKKLRARERAVKEREKEFAQASKELKELKAQLEDDPVGFALEHLGGEAGVKKLSERFLNKGRPSAEEELEITKKKQEREKAETKAQEEAEQETKNSEYVEAYFEDLKKLASKDERFELVKLEGAERDALEVAILHFQETGEVMEHAQALEIMESYLEEEHKKKFASPKLKKLLGVAEKKEDQETEPPPKSVGKEGGSTPPKKPPEEMTDEEWRKQVLREHNAI